MGKGEIARYEQFLSFSHSVFQKTCTAKPGFVWERIKRKPKPCQFHLCRFIQESSRWLITKQRYKDAETTVENIAKINGFDVPDVSKIISQAEEELKAEKNSKTNASLLDLVRTCSRARTTFSLIFIW